MDTPVRTSIARLLQLPESDPHILSDEIHDFLRSVHSRLVRVNPGTVPMLVVHIGHLAAKGENSDARELLKRFPEHDESALGAIVVYLRFATRNPPRFAGTTFYSRLAPEDLFLGACYYEGRALPILANQSKWDYASVKRALLGRGEWHDLNHFKVRGLQPRIAEISFRTIYGLLKDANAAEKLRDLNLECVKCTGSP